MRLMSVQGQYPTSFAFPDTKLFYRPAQTRQRPALPPANHCPARAVGVELDFLSDKKSTGWPSRADIVDRAGGSDNAESVDGSFWDEGDIRSLFEQVLSLPQRHVRPTFRCGKLQFGSRAGPGR
jgi:hypothetical protein